MNAVIATVDIGKITVVLPSGEPSEHIGTRPGPSAAINIHRWRAVRRLATGGDLGFAEAYIDGDWSTPDLEACLELAARNIDMLDGKISGHLAVGCCTGSAMRCARTTRPAAGRTSPIITTSAMPSTGSGSIRA